MKREQFEQCAKEAYLAIPEQIRDNIVNLVFMIEDRPPKDMEPDLLGYYIGVPSTEWESAYKALPDTIILYKETIEEEASATDGNIERVIRETVWHEVGHCLGIDEEHMEVYEHKWDGIRNSIPSQK